MKCLNRLPDNSLVLQVYVQPRASKNRLAGTHGDSIKIYVTAPPVDNKANEAVIQIVADLFKVPKSAVSLKSGSQGRRKKIMISNLSLAEARKSLTAALTQT